MKLIAHPLILIILLAALCGCQADKPQSRNMDFSFNRGAQLLAAGSPKSAIPFLTQTIASAPQDPEPVALLALAFALDLQSEQALQQAQKVHRAPADPPGWEAVAVGIAETLRQRPDPAIASFQRVLATAPADSPMIPATLQWLVLAQVLKGDHPAALDTLDKLATFPPMKTSALLWTTLIRSHDGQTQQAADALSLCATDITASFHQPTIEGTLDDQTLNDIGIAAIAAGKLDEARHLLADLKNRDTKGGDAPIWLALISAAQGSWQDTLNTLNTASETAPPTTRGLANQLCTILRALEDRPESMIQHMLEGQRLMSRGVTSHVTESPEHESVWFSDSIK